MTVLIKLTIYIYIYINVPMDVYAYSWLLIDLCKRDRVSKDDHLGQNLVHSNLDGKRHVPMNFLNSFH